MPEQDPDPVPGGARALEAQALGGLDMVVDALDRALETVQHQDVELASMVIADDDRIDGRYLEVHQAILSLLAHQAPGGGRPAPRRRPAARDEDIERMGDQCVNMAKLVPLAGHEPPADARLVERIQQMGKRRASRSQAKQAFEARDVDLAQDLVRQDDQIDGLNRSVSDRAADRGRPRPPRMGDDDDARRSGIERIGDNAVDIGEQTVFVVTGLFREFEDASHPGARRRSRRPESRVSLGWARAALVRHHDLGGLLGVMSG